MVMIMKVYTRSKPFNLFKSFLRIFVRKPKFIFLGDEFVDNAIYLSNHCGAKGPLSLELYFPKHFRYWGTYEMNSSFSKRFKYLYLTYFHQKKHICKFLSFLIAIPATPLLTIFYKGLNLISTYPDGRVYSTIKTSMQVLTKDKKSLIIFPENSSDGYHNVLKEFHPGFISIADICLRNNVDLPIYLMYYQKKKRTFIVDKPIMTSKMLESNLSAKEIAEKFKDRCNELGQMDLN